MLRAIGTERKIKEKMCIRDRGKESFETAEREDKPIFMSIGYSTCHWCHVMEEESFENDEIAGILNREFVCVKVDREERPDVDSVYMSVCQAMTGPVSYTHLDVYKRQV